MISVTDAIDIIRKHIPEPRPESVALENATGRCLATDIRAPEAAPRYDNSAMDGFAVRWQDVSHVSPDQPAALAVIGESQAGIPFAGVVGPGQAVRISTGAMVPDGADTIIRVEDTTEENNTVHIRACRKKGQDLRRRGEEFQAGDLLLTKGECLAAPQLALLASVGRHDVPVYRPPTVALLITGTELVAGGDAIADHQIRDSNSIMLRAAVTEAGGAVVHCHRVADDLDATVAAIDQANADIILCSGGVSVGRHDHVRTAADRNGFTELFWRIRQKPGKPLFFAGKGEQLLFGLPGNPVSAFMCYTHYVRPIIRTLTGRPFGWPTVSARLDSDIENPGRRTNLMRVRMAWHSPDGYHITDAARQGSHMLTSLTEANGYIMLQPEQRLAAGDAVEVYRFTG